MSIAISPTQQLTDLRDEICRLLPPYEAEDWRQRFDDTAADTDLSRVWDQFSRWLLLNEQMGVYQYAKTDEQRTLITRAAIGGTVDYDVLFRAAVSATAGSRPSGAPGAGCTRTPSSTAWVPASPAACAGCNHAGSVTGAG